MDTPWKGGDCPAHQFYVQSRADGMVRRNEMLRHTGPLFMFRAIALTLRAPLRR